MKRKIIPGALFIVVVVVLAGGMYVASLFQDESQRRKSTRIEVDARDPGGNRLSFARATFLGRNGQTLKTTWLVSHGGSLGEMVYEPATNHPLKWSYAEEGWGNVVGRVYIEAYGCEGRAPVSIEARKSGSGSPLSHEFGVTYIVSATIQAQPTGQTGDASDFLEPLLGFLQKGPDGDYAQAYLYRVALLELRRIGSRAGQALPLLIAIFADSTTATLRDLPYKDELIDALTAVGDDNPAVIATLHALLTNRDLTGYYHPAILTLRKQGPNRQGVMPALIASLAYDEEYRALSVFVEWGPQAAAAVPAIIDILRTSDDPTVISGALFALKQIGTPAALKGHRQYEHRLQAR